MQVLKYKSQQGYRLPLLSGKVPAGFPLNTESHVEEWVDLNEMIVRDPDSMFMIEAVGALKANGVKDIYATVSHGILSGDAIAKLNGCRDLKELVVTDSIPLSKAKQISKITVVTIASLLAEAIHRIHGEESISCLFDVTN